MSVNHKLLCVLFELNALYYTFLELLTLFNIKKIEKAKKIAYDFKSSTYVIYNQVLDAV